MQTAEASDNDNKIASRRATAGHADSIRAGEQESSDNSNDNSNSNNTACSITPRQHVKRT